MGADGKPIGKTKSKAAFVPLEAKEPTVQADQQAAEKAPAPAAGGH
jgi:hypothetical protein